MISVSEIPGKENKGDERERERQDGDVTLQSLREMAAMIKMSDVQGGMKGDNM